MSLPDDNAFAEALAAASRTLENRRLYKWQDYRWRRNLFCIAGMVLTLFLFVPSFDSAGMKIGWFLFSVILLIFFTVAGSMWISSPVRAYAEDYKNIVLPRIARLFGLKYSAGRELSYETLSGFGVMQRSGMTDLGYGVFYGHYQGAEICWADFLTYETSIGDGSVRRAFGILVELPREAFGHTVVVAERVRLRKDHFGKYGLRRADMVDPDFERLYDVYTDDQVEARYLIGPDMIEKIKDVFRSGFSEEFSLAFKGRSAFVFFQNADIGIIPQPEIDRASGKGFLSLFDPGVLAQGAIDSYQIEKIRSEIAAVLRLVDYLNIYKPQR